MSSKQLVRVLFPERSQCWEMLWTQFRETAKLEFIDSSFVWKRRGIHSPEGANFSERLESEVRFSFKLGDGAWKDRVIERIKLLRASR